MSARRLGPGDRDDLRAVLAVFAEAFEDAPTYLGRPPGDAWLDGLLADPSFFAIAASADGRVVGGLAGYLLRKFEQERCEFYVYDLAVLASHRRRGLATAMIATAGREAARAGAWVMYVQADHGDDPAIALYTKLGTREDVMHFDLPVQPRGEP